MTRPLLKALNRAHKPKGAAHVSLPLKQLLRLSEADFAAYEKRVYADSTTAQRAHHAANKDATFQAWFSEEDWQALTPAERADFEKCHDEQKAFTVAPRFSCHFSGCVCGTRMLRKHTPDNLKVFWRSPHGDTPRIDHYDQAEIDRVEQLHYSGYLWDLSDAKQVELLSPFEVAFLRDVVTQTEHFKARWQRWLSEGRPLTRQNFLSHRLAKGKPFRREGYSFDVGVRSGENMKGNL